MKKLLCFIFLVNTVIANAESCSCGSYESGMYRYDVKDGSGGCCDGTGSGNGYFSTYTPGPGRTWVLKDIQILKVSDAMNKCCPNS